MKRRNVVFVANATELVNLVASIQGRIDEDDSIEITFRFGLYLVSVLTCNTDKYAILKELY